MSLDEAAGQVLLEVFLLVSQLQVGFLVSSVAELEFGILLAASVAAELVRGPLAAPAAGFLMPSVAELEVDLLVPSMASLLVVAGFFVR